MKYVFFAKGERSVCCLQALLQAGQQPVCVVAQPGTGTWPDRLGDLIGQARIPCIYPEDPNSPEVEDQLRSFQPDVFVLAGYGKILGKSLLDVPRRLSVNLHGGKLPLYRGSSPMNWALINGDTTFTLTIMTVNEGVDTGDILAERTFPIAIDDTIRDLHETANSTFPRMLVEVLTEIEQDTLVGRQQDTAHARYFPLRFPSDGVVLWDQLTAEQVHNRIRALTDPYPGAFTWFAGRKVRLLSSELYEGEYFGEPGRVYKISRSRGLLVCCKDRCLWIRDGAFLDTNQPLREAVERYEQFATVSQAAAAWHGSFTENAAAWSCALFGGVSQRESL